MWTMRLRSEDLAASNLGDASDASRREPSGRDTGLSVPCSGAVRLRNSGLSSREVGGEVVVLDLENSRYLTVSGSGVLLFELLHEEHDRDELVAALVATFEVDEDTARRDVDSFISDLSDTGLLSR